MTRLTPTLRLTRLLQRPPEALAPPAAEKSTPRTWPQLGRLPHRLLWLALLALTIPVVLWPVSPSPLDPLPVQSIHALELLPAFIALLFVWTGVFGGLLVLTSGGVWERAGLVAVFTLVFVQFWGLNAPWGNSTDSAWILGHVNYIDRTGQIPPAGHPVLRYFDFPGFPLYGATMAQVSGLETVVAARAYIVAAGQLISLISFVVFVRLLDSPFRAAIATVVALAGSIVLGVVGNQFHPINMSTIYIVTFMVLFIRQVDRPDIAGKLLLLVLAVASVPEYMFTPVFFSMVFLSGVVVAQIVRRRFSASLSTAAIPVFALLAWELYWTQWNFRDLASQLPRIVNDFETFGWLRPTFQILQGNLGPRLPLWANVARLYWWVTLFAIGTLVLLWWLWKIRQADDRRRLELTLFLGCLSTIAVGSAMTVGVVHGGLSRYVLVAPLILAPVMVGLLFRIQRRAVIAALIVAGLVMVPFNFLANGAKVSWSRVYAQELAGAAFLNETAPLGQGKTVYFAALSTLSQTTYDVSAVLPVDVYGLTPELMWPRQQILLDGYRASAPDTSYYLRLLKARAAYQERLGIERDDPNWQALDATIAQTNRVYDIGDLQWFAR